MLKKLIIVGNPLDLDSIEEFKDIENIYDFLSKKYPTLPNNVKFYDGVVCQQNDITPIDKQSILNLVKVEDSLSIVIYPADPVTLTNIAVSLALAAISFVLSLLFSSGQDEVSQVAEVGNAVEPQYRAKSPNNILGKVTNSARPKARIPDIYGTLLATPDLLGTAYTRYYDNKETQLGFLCLGVGEFEVSSDKIFIGGTLASTLSNLNIEVYKPYSNPNFGASADLTIGSPINTLLKSTTRCSAVTGQVLLGRSASTFTTPSLNFTLSYSNKRISESGASFTNTFSIGDYVEYQNPQISTIPTISGAFTLSPSNNTVEILTADLNMHHLLKAGDNVNLYITDFSNGGPTYTDVSGVYQILEVISSTVIKLQNPENVDPVFWNTSIDHLAFGNIGGNKDVNFDYSGVFLISSLTDENLNLDDPGETNVFWDDELQYELSYPQADGYASVGLATLKPIGPFQINHKNATSVLVNIVAANGLYSLNDKQYQSDLVIELDIIITPVDISGSPTGSSITHSKIIQGSGIQRELIGSTFEITFPATDNLTVEVIRTTFPIVGTGGAVSDTIRFQSLYAQSDLGVIDFGNLTLIQTKVEPNVDDKTIGGALTMEVTRKLPQRIGTTNTFTSDLYPTNNIADIICAISLDPYIGNRDIDELDVDNIYNTSAEIDTYFNNPDCSEFSYTFDNSNMTFEEILTTISAAAFCTAYRQGNKIKLFFEKETDTSVRLFNHRNKIPKSETRVVTFGNVNDYDGIEMSWVDPSTNEVEIFYIPSDKSAINAKSFTAIGVRNLSQAHRLAYRAWNKIRYQNVTTEFKATQEADPLVLGERILVADNTRSSTQDGEVVDQNILELTLSQRTIFEDNENYTIFLSHVDGTVQSIEVTAGSDDFKVILAEAPTLSLALDVDLYARTVYQVVKDGGNASRAFLVVEKEPLDNFTSDLKAVLYDERFYQNDDGSIS